MTEDNGLQDEKFLSTLPDSYIDLLIDNRKKTIQRGEKALVHNKAFLKVLLKEKRRRTPKSATKAI